MKAGLLVKGSTSLLDSMRIMSIRLEHVMDMIRPKEGMSYNINGANEIRIGNYVTVYCMITSQEVSLRILFENEEHIRNSKVKYNLEYNNMVLSMSFDGAKNRPNILLSFNNGRIQINEPLRQETNNETCFICGDGKTGHIKFVLNKVEFINKIMSHVMNNYGEYFADIISKEAFNNN